MPKEMREEGSLSGSKSFLLEPCVEEGVVLWGSYDPCSFGLPFR